MFNPFFLTSWAPRVACPHPPGQPQGLGSPLWLQLPCVGGPVTVHPSSCLQAPPLLAPPLAVLCSAPCSPPPNPAGLAFLWGSGSVERGGMG